MNATAVCDHQARSLLPWTEAAARIQALAKPIVGEESVPLLEAVGRVLAAPVRSVVPLPRFDHAAMDGYAVNTSHLAGPPPYRLPVHMRITAGTVPLPPGTSGAVRIFTGAPLPEGFDAVVPQERTRCEPDHVILEDLPSAGWNVRRLGEDISPGTEVLPAEAVVDARHVAVAAAIGASTLCVRRRLRVAVFSTGDELAQPRHGLRPGSIFDSNRPMLEALLTRYPVTVTDLGTFSDAREVLRDAVLEAARGHDLLVSTGGVSVGEEDYVARLIAALCKPFELLRIAIKPGKPVAAGRLGDAVWLGLPGNPFAALVAFLVLGRPVLARLSGRTAATPLPGRAALAAFHYARKAGSDEFLPAQIIGYDPGGVPIVGRTGGGGSARLHPLILADGLVMIDRRDGGVMPGGGVTFCPFVELLSP
jgi:molybdopterin molybdotransferase